MIGAKTRVAGVAPRMGKSQFVSILRDSPVPKSDAEGGYDVLVRWNLDPAFALAVFWHESHFGTQGICAEYKTRSPGNCRSLRAGKGVPILTPQGEYIRYITWIDGFEDLAYRLVDPNYVYAQRGAVTIGSILPIFAPPSDNNSPEVYIASVVESMTKWVEEGVHTMRDPQAIWMPSSNFTPGRNGHKVIGMVKHITQGNDSLGWLRGAAGGTTNRETSAQYLIAKNGTLYQLVDELDTAHTAGNLLYNQQRIQVEYEGWSGEPLTDAQIQTGRELTARIASRHNFEVNRRNIIGHYQVPNPKDPTKFGGLSGHVGCPGPAFPWNALLGKVDQPKQTVFTAPTGFKIQGGFYTFWLDLDKYQANIRLLGWPLTDEFIAHIPGWSQNFTFQIFERVTLIWEAGISGLWSVHALTGLEDTLVRAWARSQGKLPALNDRERELLRVSLGDELKVK